jgi:hypothetical protein
MELLVYPAIYYLWRSQSLKRQSQPPPPTLPATEVPH